MNEKKNNNKKSKKIKKPNPFLYYPICLIVMPFFKLYLKTKYDRNAIKHLKGPALIVCPHISNIDFILVAFALFPKRPTFVVSEHFMIKPKIKWFLEKMAVIPKKMYCADIRTILTIMRAKEQNHIIVLFPEGRLTCFGHSVNLTEGTAELVKKLGIDVYTITGNGAYLTMPKWDTHKFRPGGINVETAKLLEKDRLKDMSVDEINTILEQAILHDEDHAMEGVFYRCSEPASGLDGILYRCPKCGAEFQMETSGDSIKCRVCSFTSRLDPYYRLHGGPFETINDWYFWQQDQIDLGIPLESDTIVAAVGADGYIDRNAGKGHIRMDREQIYFSGEVFGRPLEFSESTSAVKAFPASVGSHFDIYHKKVLYNMHLRPDPRTIIKWVCYLDKLNHNVPTPDIKTEI